MNGDPLRERVLALAGIFQAASLANQVARMGVADALPLSASIHSLFVLDPPETAAVYGGAGGVSRGLEVLSRQLEPGTGGRDPDVTRYVVALLHLERKLVRRGDLVERLRRGIQGATSQAEHFAFHHPNVIANLADLYANTVSTLSPRIMVRGEPMFLNNPDNANRIRALLLAGIRSAVLWRRLGGTRLSLLFSRQRILAMARALHPAANA